MHIFLFLLLVYPGGHRALSAISAPQQQIIAPSNEPTITNSIGTSVNVTLKPVEFKGSAEKFAKRKRELVQGHPSVLGGMGCRDQRPLQRSLSLLGTLSIAEEVARAYDAEARRI